MLSGGQGATCGRQKPLRGCPLGPPTSRSLRPDRAVSIQGARSPVLHLRTHTTSFQPAGNKRAWGTGRPACTQVVARKARQPGPSLRRTSAVLAEKVSEVTTNREADPQVHGSLYLAHRHCAICYGLTPSPPLQGPRPSGAVICPRATPRRCWPTCGFDRSPAALRAATPGH